MSELEGTGSPTTPLGQTPGTVTRQSFPKLGLTLFWLPVTVTFHSGAGVLGTYDTNECVYVSTGIYVCAEVYGTAMCECGDVCVDTGECSVNTCLHQKPKERRGGTRHL